MENEFLNSMYYLLPALSRLMGAAERDTRPESYDDERVETLMDLLEQVISKFARTPEGAGLRNTEAACALFMVAGFIADTQIVDHEATRTPPWGDCLAAAPVIGESDNSNGSDRNYRFDYQAGVRDTFPQEGIAGLWNAEEGADGRRRRTLDKGVDQ